MSEERTDGSEFDSQRRDAEEPQGDAESGEDGSGAEPSKELPIEQDEGPLSAPSSAPPSSAPPKVDNEAPTTSVDLRPGMPRSPLPPEISSESTRAVNMPPGELPPTDSEMLPDVADAVGSEVLETNLYPAVYGDEWNMPQARQRGSVGRAIGFVLLAVGIAVLVVAGYFVYKPYSIRAQAAKHIDAARAECAGGRFDTALFEANAAEDVLGKNRDVFDQTAQLGLKVQIANVKRAASVFEEAREVSAGAAQGFDVALVSLRKLLEAERELVDTRMTGLVGSRLLASLEGQLDEMILGEAKRVASSEGDAAKVIDRLDDLLVHVWRRPASSVHRGIVEALDGYVEKAIADEKAATDDVFVSAIELAGKKEYDAALGALRDRTRALRALHDFVGIPSEDDLRAKTTSLAEKKIPESLWEGGRLKTLPDAAANFFAVVASLMDASEIAQGAVANAEAGDELKALLEKATALEKEIEWSGGESQNRIGAYIEEVTGLDATYDGHRSKMAQGDAAAFAAASCIDAAIGSDVVLVRPARITSGDSGVSADMTIDGARAQFTAPPGSFKRSMFLGIRGYRMKLPWAHNRLCTHMLAAERLTRAMAGSNVSRKLAREWKVIEGPSFPVALATVGEQQVCFVLSGDGQADDSGDLCEVEFDDNWTEAQDRGDDGEDPATTEFREAAQALAENIRADELIELDIRQALVPVIESSFGKSDPRDLLEPEFCRRIVDEGYLESQVAAIGETHAEALARYRAAAKALSEARAIFRLRMQGGIVHTAMRSIDTALSDDDEKDDPFNVDLWRSYDPERGVTRFSSLLKQGMFYSMYKVAEYKGEHRTAHVLQPPVLRLLTHMGAKVIARFDPATSKVDIDEAEWRRALATEIKPARRDALGEPGWEFPPHVPLFDSTGRTVGIALPTGILKSPDFDSIGDDQLRRKKQDEFLDECALTLKSPGELGLFFRYMMQYCHDSPVQSMPKLVGNHVAQGEMHQTVYEFLDRKLGGLFTGDCDDISEFFQVVTRRQGKLSHVFSLPKHAACGYVERLEPEGEGEPAYQLVFLQTGPPVIFKGDTLDETVEKGILHFSEDEAPHFTVASVPFLFRFAGEKVRTQYWLSDRILVDEEYADLLILVQSYWHYHYYATAIRTMEERLKTDKDISNFIELSGLYRRVRLYRRAIQMQREALKVQSRNDEKVRLNEVADLASYHHRLKQDQTANLILAEVTSVANLLRKTGNYEELYRLMPVRLETAALYCSMKDPSAAHTLLESDFRFFLQARGELIEPLRDAALTICLSIRKLMDEGKKLTETQEAIRKRLLDILRDQFASKVFKKDDSFNAQIRNYTDLSLLAAAIDGKEAIRQKLLEDGPYPEAPRERPRTGRLITEDDWAWIRVCAPVYAGQIVQLTSTAAEEDEGFWEDEGSFEPEKAERLADAMARGMEAGRKLGSMTMFEDSILRVDLLRAMIKKDLDGFSSVLAKAAKMANDRHIQRLAVELGRSARLIPLEEFPKWIDAFREHIDAKQHFFHIAHTALWNRNKEYAFALADRAVEYFPEEKMMAEEAKYMRELSEQLDAKDAEIKLQASLRDLWKPLYNETLAVARSGDLASSVKTGLKALAFADELGDEHPEVEMTLELLAEVEGLSGSHEQSMAHFSRAVSLWEAQGFLSYDATAAFIGRIGRNLSRAGRMEDAERVYSLGIEKAGKAYGPNSVKMANALYALADFSEQRGEMARAVELFTRVRAIDVEVYGAEHGEVAFDTGRLAKVTANVEKYAEAEELYVDAVRLTEALQSSASKLPPLLVGLAHVREELGKLDEAEADLKRARDVHVKASGAESNEVAELLMELGDLWALKGDTDKTRDFYNRAIAMFTKLNEQDHDRARNALDAFGTALTKVKDYRGAEEQYLEMLSIDERVLGPEHLLVATDLERLAELASLAGDSAKAEAYSERARKIRGGDEVEIME